MRDETGQGGSDWLVQLWIPRLEEVLEAMTGVRPAIATKGPQLDDFRNSASSLSWWRQKIDARGEGAVWVGAHSGLPEATGGRALRAAGVEDPEPDDTQATYQELLQQTLSAFAQALGARFGEEFSCLEGQPGSPPPEAPAYAIEIVYPGSPPAEMLVAFDSRLQSLAPMPVESGESLSGAVHSALDAPTDQRPDNHEPITSKTIGLILDVELPVSVSFGRAHLPLKDVLKLTSGSIVELNRSVAEPVEVIVNNCVIARGEVVVVEGNYGVRISQIISRQDRLRTLN